MAGQRIDIMDLRLLIHLKSKGMRNRRVAEALGVNRNTVNTYVRTFSEHQLSYQRLSDFSEARACRTVSPSQLQRHRSVRATGRLFSTLCKKTAENRLYAASLVERVPGSSPRRRLPVHPVCDLLRQWTGKTRASGI